MDKKIINWFGSISQGQGYSGSGENIVVALEKLGYEVHNIGFNEAPRENLTPAGQKLRNRPFKIGEIAIAYGAPVSFDSMAGWKYRFGFSMFETDKLPAAKVWRGKDADICNKLTGLIVPSEHSKQLFSDIGVACPISVIPLGVDTSFYTPIDRPQRKPFTFLQLGNLSVRKNVAGVINAFLALYKDNPEVQLIIKTGGYSVPEMEIAKNVKIVNERSLPEQIKQFYYDADCFVFPSRGEGFGLPPLEAMATGLPTIVADNSGMSDYIDDRYMYPIRKHTLKPTIGFPKEWGDVGNWYEPDYNELKSLMAYVYNNREEAKAKGMAASRYVSDNFSFDNTAKMIVELFEKLYNK